MDSYTLYSIDGHPNLVGASLQFSLFNYTPYFLEERDKMEYYLYNKDLFKDKNKVSEFLATKIGAPDRTTHLEKSLHPYNIFIEDELRQEDYHFDLDNSYIMLNKITESLSGKNLDFKEGGNEEGLTEEDLATIIEENQIIDIVDSISLSYVNNFAWIPIIGHSHPTAQYLGPGEGYANVSIKTSNLDFITRITKTYSNLMSNNEFGFYDDRYLVKSSLFNLAEFNILSISNIAISTIPSKPGWSDININFNKNSYEFVSKIVNPVWDYDQYWGLQRVLSIEQNEIIAEKLKASSEKSLNNSALKEIQGATEANVTSMDITALNHIRTAIDKYYNTADLKKVLKDGFKIKSARKDVTAIASNKDSYFIGQAFEIIKEYEEKEGKYFPHFDSLNSTYWSSWFHNKFYDMYFNQGGRQLFEAKSKEFLEIATNKSYINKENYYAYLGRSIEFECLDLKNKDALIGELSNVFSEFNKEKGATYFTNGVRNNSLIVNYTGKTGASSTSIEKTPSTNTPKSEADIKAEQDKKKKDEELSEALTQYEVAQKPFAGHRYFPFIDDFISTSVLLSNTMGNWFASKHLEGLTKYLTDIESTAKDFCQPTRNWEAWTNAYGVPKGLRDNIKNAAQTSPVAVIEEVLKPVTSRDYNGDPDNRNGILYKVKDEETGDYPINTFSDTMLMKTYMSNNYTRAEELSSSVDAWFQNNINVVAWEDSQVVPGQTTQSTANPKSLADHLNLNSRQILNQSADNSLQLPGSQTMSSIAPEIFNEPLRALGIKDPFPSRRGVLEAQRVIYDLNSSPISYAAKTAADKESVISQTEGPRISNLPENQSRDISNYMLPNAYNTTTTGDTSFNLSNVLPNGSVNGGFSDPILNSVNDYIKKDLVGRLSNLTAYTKKITEGYLSSLQTTSCLENAFPTYKLYIIQEDTSEVKFYSLDDYYDFRLLRDVLVIRGKDQFVHILKARIIVDPRYITTNPKIIQKLHRFPSEFDTSLGAPSDKIDTASENYENKNRMPLRTGMRVCLKLGYHSDPRAMETVFIGTIGSLNGRPELGVYDLEAEGDGRELTVPATRTQQNLTGSYFAQIISKILVSNPNVTHFGKVYGTYIEKLSQRHYTLLRIAKDAIFPMDVIARDGLLSTSTLLHGMGKVVRNGIMLMPTPLAAPAAALNLAIDGKESLPALLWGKRGKIWEEEVGRKLNKFWDEREYSSKYEWSGTVDYFKGKVFDPKKGSMQIGKILNETWLENNNPVDDNIFAVDIWTSFWSNEVSININASTSIWDVLSTIKKTYPNYALDVRPYGNRSTIFLGPIGYNYWRTDDPIQAMAPALLTLGGGQKLSDQQVEAIKKTATQLDSKKRVADAGIAPFIPFQKNHIVTSDNDIIVNGVRGTPFRGWNSVVVSYGKDAQNPDSDDIVEVVADIDIEPGALKKKYVMASWTNSKKMAKLYALGLLKEGVEKMYGGTLIIRGNAKIEPYDKVYICDKINRMFGWVEVETVIHKFDSEMGFTTHIVPNMVCSINNDAYLTGSHIAKEMLLKRVTISGLLWSLGATAAGVIVGAFTLNPILGMAAGSAVTGLEYFFTKNKETSEEMASSTGGTTVRAEREMATGVLEDAYNAEFTLKSYMAGYLVAGIYRHVWRELKAGMTKDAVSAKIGARIKEATSGSTSSFWKNLKGIAIKGDVGRFASAKGAASAFGGSLSRVAGAITKRSLAPGTMLRAGSKFVKGTGSLALMGMLLEIVPLAIEGLAIKAATNNNAIIINPIWQRGQLIMQGLEGYKNNTLWGHYQDKITAVNYAANEAAKYVEGTYGQIGTFTEDPIKFVPTNAMATQINSTSLTTKKKRLDSYNGLIKSMALKYGIEPAFVKAIMDQESAGNPGATSSAGAMGLMQIIPKTWRDIKSQAKGILLTDPYDPKQSIEASCWLLRSLTKRSNGDKQLILCYYNAGDVQVNRHGKNLSGYWKETQNYVPSVMYKYRQYLNDPGLK
ncbi:MAG: lytic transglycosylase domain-containing protein [Tenuifilaceae bacterium]|nr:lytic transglycosylase domain-containing protein [Tenuifilaceae bacterium]